MAQAWTDYIEITLAFLLAYRKGYDAHLLISSEPFTSLDPQDHITITSPTCGPSNSLLSPFHTQLNPRDPCPTLAWTLPASLSGRVKQYVLIVEDPDTPLFAPICHGIVWGIPGSTTQITAEDLTLVDPSDRGKGLKSGWNMGVNLRGKHYAGARALLGHGEHRYFYEVLALGEELKPMSGETGLGRKERKKKYKGKVEEMVMELGISRTDVTMEEMAAAIKGKVVGYGVWVGRFERRFGIKYEIGGT